MRREKKTKAGALIIMMLAAVMFSMPAYADLTDGLEAYYPFSGNATDESGHGRDGTLYGPSGANPSGPALTTDQYAATDSAYDFDGTDDRIDTADFDLPDTFSLSMWVNPDDPTGESQFFFLGKHDAGGENILLFGIFQGKYALLIREESHYEITPTSGWQHLAVVVEATGGSSNVTMYKNGSVLWEQELSAVVGDMSGKPWTIGQEWDGDNATDHFDGKIDEVRIYSRALNAGDIWKLAGIVVLPKYIEHSLDPPDGPDSPDTAMYTIEDIINYLDTGVVVTKRTEGFTEPTSPPGLTGHTLDEIHAKVTERCITCEGILSEGGRWCDQGDGTIKDMETGLVWLKDAGCKGMMTWADAIRDPIENLRSGDCGLSDGSVWGDWRLPTKTELYNLANGTEAVRSGSMQLFTGVQSHYYWSGTSYDYDPGYAWYVHMDFGIAHDGTKLNNFYVWPVRSDN